MYANFTEYALEVASELENAGFEIYVPVSDARLNRRLDWFQFRKNGRIGYYSAANLADHRWSMPIKPSRENGSSMWVQAAEDAETFIQAAHIITQPRNYNYLVGHHSNYASDHALTGYTQV